MNTLVKYVGSAAIAGTIAVLLTLYVFSMPTESAVQTGLLAAAVALVVTYLNERQTESQTATEQN